MHKPNAARLGSYLRTWIQPNGAIYGFHNHSVWGGNPYRWADFTSGHSTFASPMMPGLALALKKCWSDEGFSLLRRLINFQAHSFQANGEYEHIGFQVGETLKKGLIHNVVPDVSLLLTAHYGKAFLPKEDIEAIREAVEKNFEGCKSYGSGRAEKNGCCNQEYTRIWAKILFDVVFGSPKFRQEAIEDIDYMYRNYFVAGLPDAESAATLRDQGFRRVEPAEYYGLMIHPLVLAYEAYGDEKHLDQALMLIRHVVRSSWVDGAGKRRFHRFWADANGEWRNVHEPMLIAGMGMTVSAMQTYTAYRSDAEIEQFLTDCDETYAHYQHPAGFFVSATGWQSECDVAPSSAWHTHDFMALVMRHEVDEAFWQAFFTYDEHAVNVLLGDQCLWVEQGQHWMIADYDTQDVFVLAGRKDENWFGRDIPAWVHSSRDLPKPLQFRDRPMFARMNDGIYLAKGCDGPLFVKSMAALEYKGAF